MGRDGLGKSFKLNPLRDLQFLELEISLRQTELLKMLTSRFREDCDHIKNPVDVKRLPYKHRICGPVAATLPLTESDL